jgi:hypothetical protein
VCQGQVHTQRTGKIGVFHISYMIIPALFLIMSGDGFDEDCRGLFEGVSQ